MQFDAMNASTGHLAGGPMYRARQGYQTDMSGSGNFDPMAMAPGAMGEVVPASAGVSRIDLNVVRALIAYPGARYFSPKVLSLTHNLASGLVAEMAESSALLALPERQDAMTATLLADDDFLAHLYELAVEVDLLDRRAIMMGEDPVLSPGLKALAADQDASLAALAVRFVAAQARFVSQAARMQIAAAQLPAPLFARLLRLAVLHGSETVDSAPASEIAAARAAYDEGATRHALGARLADQLSSREDLREAQHEWGVSLSAFLAALHHDDRLSYLRQCSLVQ